jgi:hypothetical protein
MNANDVASVLLVAGLPLQLSGFFAGGPVFDLMWLPMAVFELVLGPWLLIKGATPIAIALSKPRSTIGATT